MIVGQTAPLGDPIVQFIQFGALGMVVLAMVFGWLWPKPPVEQLKKDKKAAEDQRDGLVEVYETKVIPVLSDFNRTTQALLPMLQQLIPLIQETVMLRSPPERRPPGGRTAR